MYTRCFLRGSSSLNRPNTKNYRLLRSLIDNTIASPTNLVPLSG